MDSNGLLPAGLTVHGTPGDIAAHFAAIALLQPVRAVRGGVDCAPRAAPELAQRGRAACPLPMTVLDRCPAWPHPPSLTAGRWYIRSPDHIAAPAGFRELVQVVGEGFGVWPHPTTLMCLAALEDLAPADAVDLGCGSGLLSQAWAAAHGPVLAIDLDARAVAHAAASLARAPTAYDVRVRRAPIARVLPAATQQTLLANVPPVVHGEIAAAMTPAARTLLASGVRTVDAASTLARYHELGFVIRSAAASDGWGCWVLARR